MEIRPYEVNDAAALALIRNQIYDDTAVTAQRFHQNILDTQHVWVVAQGSEAIGYTAVFPVPGLPQVRALEGFIAPRWQRQGWGSQLLQRLIDSLREQKETEGADVQLSYCIDDTETAVYHFLRHHHFSTEHEEHHLVLPAPPYPLAPVLPPSCRLQTLPRAQALDQFLALYEQSFAPHPWYQPYTRGEVAALLNAVQDLLFLYHEAEAVGFVWIKMGPEGEAEIEPVGVATEWQGQGYGRFLLQSAIDNLASRGANHIHIGTWAQNKAALHLYRSLGFQLDHTLTYLAFSI